MKVAIAAGGTGGHFYPGLAVARELRRSGASVVFLVRTGDFVIPLLERESIPFRTLSAAGFQRRLSLKNVQAIGRLASGFTASFGILAGEQVDVLLVMGGYLSVPPALAAKFLRVPSMLHEQNVIPGLANRLLAKIVKRVAVSFESSRIAFGESALVTGNPVREEFSRLPSAADARRRFSLEPHRRTVLVFGGSLGALGLNTLVASAVRELASESDRFQVVHVTGAADHSRIASLYAPLKNLAWVEPFCHEMPAAYAAADFVISRAGASSVSELIVVRKPALLVPFPQATEDHQTANAKVLADVGAAEIHPQRDLERTGLTAVLRRWLADEAGLEERRKAFDKVSIRPSEAARIIAKETLALGA